MKSRINFQLEIFGKKNSFDTVKSKSFFFNLNKNLTIFLVTINYFFYLIFLLDLLYTEKIFQK